MKVKGKKYRKSREWEKHPHNTPIPQTDYNKIEEDLKSLSKRSHFDFKEFVVKGSEYYKFKDKFPVPPLYSVSYKDKKVLEHFISYKLLDLKKGDFYIDVVSENSPFPKLFRKRLEVRAYSQDLMYKPGINKYDIGSSAEKLPVNDETVDSISLQCAFEHFVGAIDTQFIHEVKRVLKKGGKCCIVPLYIANVGLNIIDPLLVDYKKMEFDEDVTVIGEIDLGGNFERFYSPETLINRILIPDIGLDYKIFKVTGIKEVFDKVSWHVSRVRYALLIEKRS